MNNAEYKLGRSSGSVAAVLRTYVHGRKDQKEKDTFTQVMAHPELASLHSNRKCLKKSFDFTIIVVGASGLGKSTFIRTLFDVDMHPDRSYLPAYERIDVTTEITPSTLEMDERNTKMRLTVIDTPGFGDSVDNSKCIKPISEYIDQQLEHYFHDETGLNRRNIIDSRVHCCLYFIAPNSRGLKTLDIEFLKVIQNKVNIIPIIAKADTFTNSELTSMKKLVINDIIENDIRIYEFPECDPEEDKNFVEVNEELKKLVPFAVVGSIETVQVGGKVIRGRSYPWGFVNVDDETHCDFTPLKNMLLRSHTQDLKDITEEVHYENYRALKLTRGEALPYNLCSPCSLVSPLISDPASEAERERLLAEKDAELSRMRELLSKIKKETML